MARELVHLVGGKQVPGRSGRFADAVDPWPPGLREGASFVILPTMA